MIEIGRGAIYTPIAAFRIAKLYTGNSQSPERLQQASKGNDGSIIWVNIPYHYVYSIDDLRDGVNHK